MRRPRGLVEWSAGIAALAVGVSAVTPVFVLDRVNADRRAASCASRQDLWDGEVAVIERIGLELKATPARIEVAVDNFAHDHPRPICRR